MWVIHPLMIGPDVFSTLVKFKYLPGEIVQHLSDFLIIIEILDWEI